MPNDSSNNIEEIRNRDQKSADLINNRRDFLKNSALTGGLTLLGGVGFSTNAAAYESEPYSFKEGDSSQVVSSICDSGFNSGTRIDSGGSLIYWDSSDWGDGTWTHHFSSHAHAEHFKENVNTCNWNNYAGITQQRWRARDDVSSNQVGDVGAPEWVGVQPKVSQDDSYSFGNTAYTGLKLAVTTFWPETSAIIAAGNIVGALIADMQEISPSLWDTGHKWDYNNQAKPANASHYVRFNSNGTSGDADVYAEDAFWNGYHYCGISINTYVTHRTSRIQKMSTSSSSSSYTEDTTYDERGKSHWEGVSVGDTIESEDGQEVKIKKITTKTSSHSGGSKRKVNPEEFKKRRPVEFQKKGRAPEYVARLPGITTTRAFTGTIID